MLVFDNLQNFVKELYYGVLNIAYWYFAIKTLVAIFHSSTSGDFRAVLKALGTGAVGYGSCYFVLAIFDEIKRSFRP